MQSNGGIDTFESTKNIPLTMIESGPTSGVLGAAELGKLINEKILLLSMSEEQLLNVH